MAKTATLQPNPDGTTDIVREPVDVSNKVIAATVAQFLLAVVLAVTSGEIDQAEISALAGSLITAVIGWLTKDKVQL